MLSNRQLFLSHVAQTSPAPLMLEIERAAGCYLYDNQGKEYLDLIAGISVSNMGHSYPTVVEAVKQQAEKYMHLLVYGEFVQSPQTQYAAAIAKHLPDTLNNVYFTNSGAEAVEGALKLAKRYTNRTRIVSFKNAYHGSTHGALSIIGDEYFKRSFRPLLPDTLQLTFNDVRQLQLIDKHTACVIVETVQTESGINGPTNDYLKLLRQRCDEVGALLILDEIQAGIGRTGKLFAFEHYGIVPDILLLAKAFGGGMPLGAFISSKQIMNTLTENPVLGHITTFGGHPVCCAAGLAAFTALLQENLIAQVEAKGQLFERLINHSAVIAKRRVGLLMAVEFKDFDQNKRIIDRCIEKGVLTDWFLFASNCMRIAPPLIITEEQIRHACAVINEAIEEVA